jgi:hypothetical protein
VRRKCCLRHVEEVQGDLELLPGLRAWEAPGALHEGSALWEELYLYEEGLCLYVDLGRVKPVALCEELGTSRREV